jgi:FemAB-related protein (PEP-CTERM system-associated)
METDEAVSITTASAGEARAWDAFVAAQPGASGYHSWGWRTVFERAFKHEAIYLMALREQTIVGVLPLVAIKSLLFGRTLTSLPFVNYGGVLASDSHVGQALVEAATDAARRHRCAHVELRHVAQRFPSLPCKQHKVAMVLQTGAAGWDRLDKKVRNQIRKAQKSGLTTQRGGSELLGDFYEVFARNMRDLGTPVYSRVLFEEVLREFPQRARVHVVKLDRIPVAAALTYHTAGTMEMPWASSVRDYNPLCPNHLLYWDVIQSAVENRCTQVDFGRSTPGAGTYLFKAQWGAQPVPLHWEYSLVSGDTLPDTSPTNPKYAAVIAIWKGLPLMVANRIGPPLVRQIP